ncbi:MAG TPA: glycosyltransferase family 39 protein [Pseudolabrys sp.]|nr:glycosyltransferase family 39 protein [Pseudolabrys sp.]
MRAVFNRLRIRRESFERYDPVVAVLFIVLAALVLTTFHSYAISNDEEVQQHYGELIIAYYRSGFTDQDVFHYINLYLYGGLFDIVAVLLQHVLTFIDPYDLRHILCAMTGVAGIGATWATARLVAGPRAGIIAAVALTLCGPWYGAMFNHTKDIPFAAAMMGATYFLLRAARDLPKPRHGDVIAFGLLLGAALGMRVLGLLMIGYVAIVIALRMIGMGYFAAGARREGLRFFAQSAISFVPAFVIGYLVMIAAWPWSALSPLNPIRGLIDFGHFHYQIQTVLDGRVYEMGNVPRWYVPVYLLIKLPLVMLAGAAISAFFIRWVGVRRGGMPASRREIALLAFIALFPVICEVVDRGPAFTGMRHFLFVVPVVATLAGIGFDLMLTWFGSRSRAVAIGASTALSAVFAWNAAILVELHPDEYLYYNSLVGGLKGAAPLYATDYWVNIMPEAVQDLEAFVTKLDKKDGRGRRYTVAVCGERLPFEKRADARLQWVEDWRKADFFIAPTHMNCDRALDGKIIATIQRLGAPIGVVKDRRALVMPQVASHR